MMARLEQGQRIYDLLGHPYDVLVTGSWQYRVQALTPCGDRLVPIGAPVTLGFSDLDQTRWPETTR